VLWTTALEIGQVRGCEEECRLPRFVVERVSTRVMKRATPFGSVTVLRRGARHESRHPVGPCDCTCVINRVIERVIERVTERATRVTAPPS